MQALKLQHMQKFIDGLRYASVFNRGVYHNMNLMNRLFEKINLFIVVTATSIKIQICIPAHIMNSYQSMFY